LHSEAAEAYSFTHSNQSAANFRFENSSMHLLPAHSKLKAKGDNHGNPKGYNQGLRPCMLVLLLFLRSKNKNKHACLGFASLPKGEVNICLGNVNLKKLKTHNKKLVSHILCP